MLSEPEYILSVYLKSGVPNVGPGGQMWPLGQILQALRFLAKLAHIAGDSTFPANVLILLNYDLNN